MSKVDWITWKTDSKEIINPKIIEDNMIEKFQDYNTYMNPVIYEQLKYEISRGGLDRNSINISDSYPANEMALDIIDLIEENKNIYDRLINEVLIDAEEQKKIEKKQLIKSIEDKIKQEEYNLKSINNEQLLKDNMSIEEYNNMINKRIQKLKKRLKNAESL